MAKTLRRTRLLIYGVFIFLIIGSIIAMIPKSPSINLSQVPTGGNLVPPDQYILSVGDAKTVKGIQFGFLSVESDDRCVGRDCLNDQAVSGRATLIFRAHGLTTEDIRVNTDKPTDYLNFTIRVIKLDPIPVIDLKNARVTVEIKQIQP